LKPRCSVFTTKNGKKPVIRDYGIKLLEDTGEVKRLAALYIQEEAVPAAYPTDAAHIARPWTIERVRRVNGRENYKGVGIYKPAEVLEL
jgi:hypothetical protein